MEEDNFTAIFDRLASVTGSAKPADIAKGLEVTPQSMSHFKKTKKFPPDLIIKYCLKKSISLDWMFKGVGPARSGFPSNTDGDSGIIIKDNLIEYSFQNNANDDHIRETIIGELKHLHGKKLRRFLRSVLEEIDGEGS